MGVLDSSYIKAMGVESAGLKKLFLFFQDTLLLNVIFFDMGSLREGESLKPVRNPTIPGHLCPPVLLPPIHPIIIVKGTWLSLSSKDRDIQGKEFHQFIPIFTCPSQNIVTMRVIVSKIIS